MRCSLAITLGLLCLVGEIGLSRAAAEPPPQTSDSWSLRDGDRVALIGGTFIEREQRYGYLETALTISNPDRSIVFRNLGWSGDTVGGVSRSGFDPPEAGFKQLVDQVNAVRPTVIVVGYGANESFAGKAGLDDFTKGLERLIDALRPTKARFVFLAPLKQEDMGRPLPDPAKHNRDIALYSDAIQGIAKRMGAEFVDLDPFMNPGSSAEPVRLTDNGIHLTALGFWKLATCLESDHPNRFKHSITQDNVLGSSGKVTLSVESSRAVNSELTDKSIRLAVQEARLPMSPCPAGFPGAEKWAGAGQSRMKVAGLAPGRYRLMLDGKLAAEGTDRDWSEGIVRARGPELDQVEQLRQTILKKNVLFFHRWRPQNITYLFGFRKHEQGNNAVEIPRFDPLVAEQERKIAVLKKPVPHVYELIREETKGAVR